MIARFATWNEVVGLPTAARPGQRVDRRPAHTRNIALDTQQRDNALTEQELTTIHCHYRGAAADEITNNTTRAGPLAADALTLAKCFRKHETMILRFIVDLAVPGTYNQSECNVRPVKIQQPTSGGAWHTLTGIADFAVVQPHLSTATKWGVDTLDVCTQLFTTDAWLPPAAAEPC
jgi:transposase